MTKQIEFEKVFVHETGRVTVYKSSERLTKKANGKIYRDEGEIIKLYSNKEKTETKEHKLTPWFEYVAISDAHTHIERLAFPCWIIEKADFSHPYFWLTDTIAGVNTLMIHGGDIQTVKPHDVYLKMLAKANGFYYRTGRKNETV